MILFVFRARSQATKLYEKLKNGGLAWLVSTPSGLTNGCSLSVKTDEKLLYQAQSVINSQRLNTFIGAYYLGENGEITGRIRLSY
ncbi:MAG: DUF3343 domain-containing protein [Clostridia bacterium]|nr:DUF3343 domain-containing protein [Clostridia bacterium]